MKVEKEIVDIEDVNNAKDTRPTADLGDGCPKCGCKTAYVTQTHTLSLSLSR